MPRLRRRGVRLQRELTFKQELELVIGPLERSAFRNDKERRKAYLQHQTELEQMVAPFHTWGWVVYQAGGFLPAEGQRVSLALRRLKVLGDKPGVEGR
jgi:hypothetical protein